MSISEFLARTKEKMVTCRCAKIWKSYDRTSVRPSTPTCHIYHHYTDAVKELVERKIQRKKKTKKGDEEKTWKI